MIQKTEKIVSKVFHVALASTFLSVIIFLFLTQLDKPVVATWGFYIIMYANFVFLPALFISLITLVVINLKSYDFQRAIEKSSLRILIVLLAAFMIYLGFEVVKNKSSGLNVVFKNNTCKPVSHIDLYGRGSITELDILDPYTDTTLVFQGIAIRSDLENDYENEVSLVYYIDDTFYRYAILEGPGRRRGISRSFQLDFYGPDSVVYSYLPDD